MTLVEQAVRELQDLSDRLDRQEIPGKQVLLVPQVLRDRRVILGVQGRLVTWERRDRLARQVLTAIRGLQGRPAARVTMGLWGLPVRVG